MAQMHLTPLSKLVDEVWGEKGTEERDAMEKQLKEEVNAYYLGEAIRKARQAQKLTQEELGERIGVQRAQISRLEKGHTIMTLPTLSRVFRALGIASATLDLGAAGKVALWYRSLLKPSLSGNPFFQPPCALALLLCAWRLFRGKRTFTFFLTDEVPTLTLIFQNEFNVNDTLYLTAQTKRKVSFDRSFAVCCGQSSAYDDNTEVEYESETSSLSYSFARHLTQALQSHKLYLISPELPVGSSILITDIESELSDATNANNHVKFKWKPLRKQVPFTVPRLHNIFNQVYNNTFD